MDQSYVYQLLQTLSREELDALGQFLKSDYYNPGVNQGKIILLFELLRKGGVLPEKEDAYALVFSGQPWVAGKLDKLMSELSGLVRKFLLAERYFAEANNFSQSLDWAVITRERRLSARYPQNIQKLEKQLDEEHKESVDYYYRRFQLAYEKYDVQSESNRFKGDLYIPQTVASLDAYYLACRLELLNLLSIQQKLTPVDAPAHLWMSFKDFLPEDTWSQHALLNIAVKIHHQLTTDTPSAGEVMEILALLQQHEQRIEPAALQHFFTYLRSLCTLLIQQGDMSFAPVLHDIQRDNLERGYLFYKEKLSPSAYLNVVKIAVTIGKTEWALAFVETYKDHILVEEDAYNYYAYSKAYCLFDLKRYQEALDMLPQLFSDLMYLLHCRRLELKLYFELESPLLPYKIDAHKMYLSRASKKVISDETREIEVGFINILLQIWQCPPKDKSKINKIIERIQDKRLLAERAWLLEKAQAL